MIQGVILDFDNTLYDYEFANHKALDKVFIFIENNYKINYKYIKQKYSDINYNIKLSNNYANKFNKYIYFKKLLESLNINLEILINIIDIYSNEFNNNIVLYDGVYNFIKLLKNNNIKVAILSNNNFKQQYDKLVKLKIINLIDYIQTSDESGIEKPYKTIYLELIDKMKISIDNLLMFGDNLEHDIKPCIELGIYSFLYNKINKNNLEFKNNFIEFNNYIDLIKLFEDYFQSEKDLIYLSKLFGQSILNIQGQGGNISIKTNDNNFILIKSSGCILGNMDQNNGFCVGNNNECLKLLENNMTDLTTIKLFGNKYPSMETFFHCFMKKYTVHLHFTLANFFLCSNKINELTNLDINHKIIGYYPPGIHLANEILKVYDSITNLYFLQNHGTIITADTIEEILLIYTKLFNYFNIIFDNNFNLEFEAFEITKILNNNFNKTIVTRPYYGINSDLLINIKYCFPDLAVYINSIHQIKNINEISLIPDILIINNNIFIIASSLTKLYCVIETLDKYALLCKNYDKLTVINSNQIQNMEQEKYRKNN